VEINSKTGKRVLRIRTSGNSISPEWGVDIGEIAHNLRSALDGLVYQLAFRNPKVIASANNTQFPVFLLGKTERRRSNGGLVPHFENTRSKDGKRIVVGDGRRMIQPLLLKHQTRIKRLQPYKRDRGGRSNPLYWLSEINNVDKHRLIQTVAAKWGGGPIVFEMGQLYSQYPIDFVKGFIVLKDGAKFGETTDDVEMDSDIMPLVAFSEGCEAVRFKFVTPTLGRIAEEVSEILKVFEDAF
jgi:hypothetical protein